jgi:hypothetical protein
VPLIEFVSFGGVDWESLQTKLQTNHETQDSMDRHEVELSQRNMVLLLMAMAQFPLMPPSASAVAPVSCE